MKLPVELIGKHAKVAGHTHLGPVCETRYIRRGRNRQLVEARVKIEGKLLRVTPDQIERTENRKKTRKR